jgi:hypothetical protein
MTTLHLEIHLEVDFLRPAATLLPPLLLIMAMMTPMASEEVSARVGAGARVRVPALAIQKGNPDVLPQTW